MKIRQFTARIIDVPLKRPFRHASAVRSESRNLLVSCELDTGIVGWGEGVPREYVTGETPENDIAALAAYPLAEIFTADCGNWGEVIGMLDRFDPKTLLDDPRSCSGNALRAAVEISVLDAFGQAFGDPIAKAIEFVPEAKSIQTPFIPSVIAPPSTREIRENSSARHSFIVSMDSNTARSKSVTRDKMTKLD